MTVTLLSGTNGTQPFCRRRMKVTRRTSPAISLRTTQALPKVGLKPTTLLHPRSLYEGIGNRLSWRITGAALALSLALPFAAYGQTPADPMAATLLPRYRLITQSFLALAEAMPADKYAFKPSSGAFQDVRSFGEQVKHVACGNFGFFNEIEKKTPPTHCETGGPSPAKTKAEIVAYLREAFAYGERFVDATTVANALDSAGGPYGGQSTRLGLITLAIWHASDHYGQLVIYSRMNGIVPPASRPAPPR
jgi:DinB superfamily